MNVCMYDLKHVNKIVCMYICMYARTYVFMYICMFLLVNATCLGLGFSTVYGGDSVGGLCGEEGSLSGLRLEHALSESEHGHRAGRESHSQTCQVSLCIYVCMYVCMYVSKFLISVLQMSIGRQ